MFKHQRRRQVGRELSWFYKQLQMIVKLRRRIVGIWPAYELQRFRFREAGLRSVVLDETAHAGNLEDTRGIDSAHALYQLAGDKTRWTCLRL